jgi:hypothetical protein
MRSRYGALAIYSTLLACVAVGTLTLANEANTVVEEP